MREGILEAIERGWSDDAYLLAHLVQQILYRLEIATAPLAVQAKVKQRELQLTDHHHAGLKVSCRQQFVQQYLGQRFSRLVVPRDERQGLSLPAPVFEKLAGQFHRIPRHAIDAGDRGHCLACQHVV